MGKIYYKKGSRRSYKKPLGLVLIILGIILFGYTLFPLISWHIYFSRSFASQKIDSPIPINEIVSSIGKDYTDANTWYGKEVENSNQKISYSLSIPKIEIINAKVTNEDSDLTTHLVQFNSDSAPGVEGNVIVFGHSTIPQWFDQKDYKTIFSNAFKLETGDKIEVDYLNKNYTYRVERSIVVDPEDSTVLSQDFSDSFLTLITCTPPGTIWKRLVIKARLEK